MLKSTATARVALVLIALGASAGVIGANLVVLAVLIAESDLPLGDIFSLDELVSVALISFVGGIAGALSAPLIGFGLLRRVPLGRAIVGITATTVLAAFLAERISPFNPYRQRFPNAFTGIAVGFILSAIALALDARQSSQTPPI